MMLTAIRKRHLLGRIVIPIAVIAVACANASGGAYSINVDHNDPAAVIQVAVQTLFSWQPGADASPVDAFDRARPLMSASLAAQEVALTTAEAGSQWQQWAYDRTIITASAEILPDEHPEDTADSARRVVAVTQTIADPGPSPQDGVHFTLWVTAVKTHDGWRVDSIQA
jgi:hypothetical protein